ncbi:hypothetical protein RBG61_05975 [Paludicola sp. MB14-C6]|uniref:hypothetical protein n=1 Tax=Paludihabitans sp. MB14-C6 TaxID=3070656 RepID=UPI0027DBA14E|nr:hypothetical protein [Paludicola sp. MB14-C6]WMJ24212.1 hypothetical protein RBG61_05975 [Paludicola sp. MB14-C6]
MAICLTCNQEYADELSTCPNCKEKEHITPQKENRFTFDVICTILSIIVLFTTGFITFMTIFWDFMIGITSVMCGLLLSTLLYGLGRIINALNRQADSLKVIEEILLSQNQNNSNGNR